MQNKGLVAGVLGVLILLTGIFAATSTDLGSGANGSDDPGTETAEQTPTETATEDQASVDDGDTATEESTGDGGEFEPTEVDDPEATVMTVNGEAVAHQEFASRVDSIEQNFAQIKAQADAGGEGSEMYTEYLETIEDVSSQDIAISSLILDLALYQEAEERGLGPSQEEVDQQIEQERSALEAAEEDPEQFGMNESQVEQFRSYVDSFGGDRYWEEVYPQQIRQQAALQQLQAEVTGAGDEAEATEEAPEEPQTPEESENSDEGAGSDGSEGAVEDAEATEEPEAPADEGPDPWLELQKQVVADADVQIEAEDLVDPGTVDGALAYLDSFWAMQEEGA